VDYIDLRYEEYMNAEARVNRRIIPDTRVHCCLYFISPNGHGYITLFEILFTGLVQSAVVDFMFVTSDLLFISQHCCCRLQCSFLTAVYFGY